MVKNYKKIENGIYRVNIVKMDLKASKKGDPMVTIWFKVISPGKYMNKLIYFNQVIKEGFQICIVNNLLEILCEGINENIDIKFETYPQYDALLNVLMKKLKNNFSYLMNYKENINGFKTYNVVKIFNEPEKKGIDSNVNIRQSKNKI